MRVTGPVPGCSSRPCALALAACAPGGSPPGSAAGRARSRRPRRRSAVPAAGAGVRPGRGDGRAHDGCRGGRVPGLVRGVPGPVGRPRPRWPSRCAARRSIAFVQPVGCDTIGRRPRWRCATGRYALGLRDVGSGIRSASWRTRRCAASAIPALQRGVLRRGQDSARAATRPCTSDRAGTSRRAHRDRLDATWRADRYDDVRETVASRLDGPAPACSRTSSTACDGRRPLLVDRSDRACGCRPAPAGDRHLAVFAVPDRLVPPGARPA